MHSSAHWVAADQAIAPCNVRHAVNWQALCPAQSLPTVYRHCEHLIVLWACNACSIYDTAWQWLHSHLDDAPEHVMGWLSTAKLFCLQAPAVSSKDSETLPVTGLVSDSADSMDVSRRQSVRSVQATVCQSVCQSVCLSVNLSIRPPLSHVCCLSHLC